MIQIYTGEGKGKTSAAMGLAIRAAGRGRQVSIVQFLKGRDTGELESFSRLPLIIVLRNKRNYGFFPMASEENKAAMIKENNENLSRALESNPDFLILDEACAAYNLGAVDRKMIDGLLGAGNYAGNPARELVLTGRDAPESFRSAADYISEIKKIKHPFDKGVKARESVEF